MAEELRTDRPWILAIDHTRLQLRTYEQLFASLSELGRFGLECHEDGEEALVRLAGLGARNLKPSLILLDWSLRGGSSARILERLQTDFRWSRIPVLAVTAAPEKDNLDAALRLGAKDSLLKPIKAALLAEKVARHAVVRLPPSPAPSP